MSNDQSPEYRLGSAVYKAFKESAKFKIVLHIGDDEKFTIVDNDAFQDGVIQQLKSSASNLIKTNEWKELPSELRCKIMEQFLSNQMTPMSMPACQPNQMMSMPACQPNQMMGMSMPACPNQMTPMYGPTYPNQMRLQARYGNHQISSGQQSSMSSTFQRAVVSAIRSGFPQAINQKTLIDEADPSTKNVIEDLKSLDLSDSVLSFNNDSKQTELFPVSSFKARLLSVSEFDFPQESLSSSSVSNKSFSSSSVSNKSDEEGDKFLIQLGNPKEIKQHNLTGRLEGKKIYKSQFELRNNTPNKLVFRVLPSTSDVAFLCDPPEVEIPCFEEATVTVRFSKSNVFLVYEELHPCDSDKFKPERERICKVMSVDL